VTQAIACLHEGEGRVAALREGKAPWRRQTGTVVLGYRSKIDGSAQPYQAYIPDNYNFDSPKPMRLDLFLHGRGGTLNELSFIRSGWVKSSFGTDKLDFLALYPYGRGNNGWRFAGEQDVFEALADFQRRYPTDPDRIMLRGFSMGGHGVWHLGLQHPGVWAAMSPGAGFVDTKNYQKMTALLPAWQEALLHLYDPLDYAANAKDLPLLHYVGELDPALAQHQLMVAALKKENAPYREFLGPQTPHRYEPKSLQAILAEIASCRRVPDASTVDFVTYTLRFPDCKWVHLTGLERHWERSEVHARVLDSNRVEVTTHNVSALTLTPPVKAGWKTLRVDGQSVSTGGLKDAAMELFKRGGRWQRGALQGLRKRPGLQGPIDDALFGPLVAVSGTGTAWNADGADWIRQEQIRFRESWGRYFRAALPEKTDATLTKEEFQSKNLYLFGDPGSNAVLRRLLPKLPLRWTKDEIVLAGKTFSTREYLPLLIFPNPENPERYIVLNTGMTFSRADQEASNARQYPHLPDFAVIRFRADAFSDRRPEDTVLAGFFDENWKISK
jgi:predicted esterase